MVHWISNTDSYVCSNCGFKCSNPYETKYHGYRCPYCLEKMGVEEQNKIEPVELASEYETVNHPNHYCQEGSMECIDEMIAVFGRKAVADFCLLNVWKYRKRALFKNKEEDIKKSDWYMNKYMELIE